MKVPFSVDLTGKTAIVTGGSGVLCSAMAYGLAVNGAKVAIIGRNKEKLAKMSETLTENAKNEYSKEATVKGYSCNVLDKEELVKTYEQIKAALGSCDILINGAGGNQPGAIASVKMLKKEKQEDDYSFWDLKEENIRNVMDLNYMGTLLPIQVFTRDMVEKRKGSIIGCGGVASVAIHKCCQNSEAFEEICIASRTKSKCDALKEKLEGTTKTKIQTAQVDANNVDELIALIEKFNPDVVLNLALPYQDLTIMDACLATKTHYIDTANYEPEDTAKFEYKWQWAYREKFKEAGITALLGSGFDPGVTGVFSAYALKHEFDEINYIDILDCNGGDHGYPFATNFNPEINIREVSANGSYWEDGHWVETKPMEIKREYDFDGVGMKDMYLLHHEEIESLALNMPGIKRMKFS